MASLPPVTGHEIAVGLALTGAFVIIGIYAARGATPPADVLTLITALTTTSSAGYYVARSQAGSPAAAKLPPPPPPAAGTGPDRVAPGSGDTAPAPGEATAQEG